jgi:alpha-mannosidase
MNRTSRIILDVKLSMLREHVFLKKVPVCGWETMEQRHYAACRYETTEPWRPIEVGDRWLCRDGITRRFKTTATLPKDFTGTAVLDVDFGGEGLVFLNGQPASALTSAADTSMENRTVRTRVYLEGRVKPGETFDIELENCLNFMEYRYRIRTGKDKDHAEYLLRRADIAVVDDCVESYLFDLENAVDALDTFQNPMGALADSNAQPNEFMSDMLKALNREGYMEKKIYAAILKSVTALDFEMGDERLRASVPGAALILRDELGAIEWQPHSTVVFQGHSHIDTAWLWPLKETVRKVGRTMANVFALMDRYPDFTFSVSQPQLLKYLEDYYPSLFEKLVQRVKEGRIELVGNAWVEMDANVPSGESLVRQLLYGRKYYLEKFGKCSDVFWMPDVFGYSWALPQIMEKSGIKYFYTSKLVNNDTNRFPHSLFLWQGVDGTRTLSYLQRLNYNGELRAKTMYSIDNLFDQRDLADEVLMTIGYGDGGGGPNYQMCENYERLKEFPGLPAARFGTAHSFFENAKPWLNELPVWNDEMYYEFNSGTYTSHADVKRNNRKGEQLLRRAEIACAMANVYLGSEYPAKKFEDIYRRFLTNQFHDILPGSSINEVYRDVAEIYEGIMTETAALFDEAVSAMNSALGVDETRVAVWNFHAFPVTGEVCVDAPGYSVVKDAPSHLSDGKLRFIAENVPPMGVRVFELGKGTSGFEGTGRMENEHLRVTLDENGNISSLYDKDECREVFAPESVNNLLQVFEDIPHRESGWNIDIEYQNKEWALEQAESVELIEDSEVRACVRVVRKFNLSTITQDIVLARGARRLDFETRVDWNEEEKMLKAAFFPDIHAQKATYEIQFGAIERPTHWNTSYDRARFEVCAHRWADLSEGMYGVSLLNDSKYGYDIKDNRMRLTLLRSPNYPHPVADRGTQVFTYSLYPHAGDWRNGTVREAHLLNAPLVAARGASCEAKEFRPESFLSLESLTAVVDAVKGAEDGNGLIVRVYEAGGARGTAKLNLGFAASGATECDLMENDQAEAEIVGGAIAFTIKPYEIKTFRVTL